MNALKCDHVSFVVSVDELTSVQSVLIKPKMCKFKQRYELLIVNKDLLSLKCWAGRGI